MTNALYAFAVLFALVGCASAPTSTQAKLDPAKEDKAAEIIKCMKTEAGDEKFGLDGSGSRMGITDMKLEEDLVNELANLGPSASPTILAYIFRTGEANYLRLALMEALYKMRDYRAVPHFIRLLDFDYEAVREKARFILENLTGAEFHLMTAAPPGPLRNQGIAEWKRWWLDHRDEYGEKYGRLPYDSSWDSIPPTE